jgi:hypothetical protein
VGLEVGLAVGTNVGDFVGAKEGAVVGDFVGAKEGSAVGDCVGEKEGSAVGCPLTVTGKHERTRSRMNNIVLSGLSALLFPRDKAECC